MAPLSILTLVAAPVVDIDGTFFVQAGIFVTLVVILNPLLFRPWLETQARRFTAIQGATSKAQDLRKEADTLIADYDGRIAEARDRASVLRRDMRHEEEQAQAQTLAQARTNAAAEGAALRAKLVEQSDAARSALGTKVNDLAESIASRLLGGPQ